MKTTENNTEVKLEETYQFELSFDNIDYTVDEVLKKLKKWQEQFGGEKVSYLISEEITGIFGMFSIKNKKLTIYITGGRHSLILCNMLGITFSKTKYKYQKDLFQLNL